MSTTATTDTSTDAAILVEGRILEGTADRARQEVIIDLIREGFGNKRDGHYYSAALLENEAGKFAASKQYINHIDEETERKLKGLPRPIEHLGGRIVETMFLPAGADFTEQGWGANPENTAVLRGRAKVAQPWLWTMIESDPELLGVSIHAGGKSNPGVMEGRQAKIVEAISNVRSVDWVTEAGAGGKVFSLVEAQVEAEIEAEPDAIEESSCSSSKGKSKGKPYKCKACDTPEDKVNADGLCGDCARAEAKESEAEEDAPTEADVTEALVLVLDVLDSTEALEGAIAGSTLDGEGVTPELVEAWEQFSDFAQADPVAAAALIEATETLEGDDDDDDDQEALSMDTDEQIEARAVELAGDRLEEALYAATATMREEYERALTEAQAEFDRLLEEAQDRHDRSLEQREQRVEAARMIENTSFKAATQAALKAEFHDAYFEAETDADGTVVTTGMELLHEAVNEAIENKTAELSDYVETRFTGAGETDESMREAGGSPGVRARKAPLDQDIDRQLGITPAPDADPAA